MMMTAIKCPPQDKLKALSLGRLMDEESEDLMAHVKSCSSCQTEMETVDDVEDSLIASIRDSGAFAEYYAEPDCQVAMASALGALAKAGEADRSNDSQTELPKQIGEYEIVRPLGRGGMGSVYLARHTKLGRQVAVKILAHHRLGDQRVRERFEMEMQAIGRLSHPNIVTAHDARDIGGTPVLVTEFIDGFDLGQLLHRIGPLSTADACEIIRQIASALEYTSTQGFVHRDVKPSNIMLGRGGEVKLLDLGLARIELGDPDRPDMTSTGQAMGTADYIAPEQVNDSRSVDVRADIYSLGCTLFKLLTGVAPFADENHTTAFAKMTAHVSAPAPSLGNKLPSAPGKLIRLVDDMLAKDPTGRPKTPADVARQLETFTSGHDLNQLLDQAEKANPTSAGTESMPLAMPRPNVQIDRKYPFSILIATGLAALLVGFALGVIVTVTFPDGSTAIIKGQDGTTVKIEDEPPTEKVEPVRITGDNRVSERRHQIIDSRILPLELKLAELQSKFGPDHPEVQAVTRQLERTKELYPELFMNNAPTSNTKGASGGAVTPLVFAVLSHSETSSLSSFSFPISNPSRKPIVTDDATWYLVDENVEIPNVQEIDGNKYAPVVADASGGVIRWEDIQGNISAQTTWGRQSGTQVEFRFHNSLADKMKSLSNRHINRDLAVIVNGRIVAAPRIASTISDRAQITGHFSRDELSYLFDALKGGLVTPYKPEKVAEKGTGSSTDISSTGMYNTVEKTPLLFAIAKKKLDESETLPRDPGGDPVVYNDTTWFPLDEQLESPSIRFGDSTLYAPIENGPDMVVTWKEIVGHMSANAKPGRRGSEPTIELEFGDKLSKKMERLTRAEHHGRELVIILYGRIVATPRINATISKRAELTGRFTDMEVLKLLNALNLGAMEKGSDGKNSRQTQGDKGNVRRWFWSKTYEPNTFRLESDETIRLRQIGMAVINYESAHRRFPASARVGDGEHISVHPHSWRVAILPFIEQAGLYERYRFDEPWDSEHNLELLDDMPDIFRSPHAPKGQKPGETNYVAFVGEKSIFGKSNGIRIRDVLDGTSRTLLFTETKASVPWTKPEDFPFDNAEDAKQAIPFDGQPLRFVMADGSVRSLPKEHFEELSKLVTRSGGETVDIEEIAPRLWAK